MLNSTEMQALSTTYVEDNIFTILYINNLHLALTNLNMRNFVKVAAIFALFVEPCRGRSTIWLTGQELVRPIVPALLWVTL